MTKFAGIALAFISLVINFLSFWYSDLLINRYFIFGLIPLWSAGLLLLVSIVLSIVSLVRAQNSVNSCISLAISLLTVIMIFVFPFRTAKVNLEMTLFEDERLQVVQMVTDGEIIPDSIGNADLPQEYRNTSSDGCIFVYQNDDEQVVSFWIFRGMLSGSVELIYSSRDESLIYENESGHPITSITELKEHWYLVETDY